MKTLAIDRETTESLHPRRRRRRLDELWDERIAPDLAERPERVLGGLKTPSEEGGPIAAPTVRIAGPVTLTRDTTILCDTLVVAKGDQVLRLVPKVAELTLVARTWEAGHGLLAIEGAEAGGAAGTAGAAGAQGSGGKAGARGRNGKDASCFHSAKRGKGGGSGGDGRPGGRGAAGGKGEDGARGTDGSAGRAGQVRPEPIDAETFVAVAAEVLEAAR